MNSCSWMLWYIIHPRRRSVALPLYLVSSLLSLTAQIVTSENVLSLWSPLQMVSSTSGFHRCLDPPCQLGWLGHVQKSEKISNWQRKLKNICCKQMNRYNDSNETVHSIVWIGFAPTGAKSCGYRGKILRLQGQTLAPVGANPIFAKMKKLGIRAFYICINIHLILETKAKCVDFQ